MGTEALFSARKLLLWSQQYSEKSVADHGGIIRLIEDSLLQTVLRQQRDFDDLIFLDPSRVLITSGITVFPEVYLQALYRGLLEKGVQFFQKKINVLEELSSFDTVVLAASEGIGELVSETK